MNIKVMTKCAAAGLVLALGSMAAEAVTIYSINMQVRSSTYQVQTGDTRAGLLAEFNSGALLCNVSLSPLDNVGSGQTCGTSYTDIATLFTIDFSQDSNTLWQFGPDWGRGGVAYREGEIVATEDLWWGYDWNSGDVLSFVTVGGGTLGLLGFEGCCGGGMSLRYSTDGGQTWQIAAVNVPEPGTLALLGLGLAGLGLTRRRKAH